MRREQKDLRAFREMLWRVRGLHREEITSFRDGQLNFEKGLFGQTCEVVSFTGDFFEELHRALYGCVKPAAHFHLVKPDYMTGDAVGDVKACSVKKDIPFRADQLEGYLGVERALAKKSFHVFYLHNGVDGRSKERDVRARAESLAYRVLGALHVPASLAVLCCNAALDSGNNLVRYSDRNSRGTWVYISTNGVRELFENPLEFVAHVGGDPSHYSVARRVSPYGFKIGDYQVERFPVVEICDANGHGLNGASVPEKLLMTGRSNGLNGLDAGLFDDGFDTPDTR